MSVLLLRKKSGFPVFVLVFNNVSGGVVHGEHEHHWHLNGALQSVLLVM